jgi:hypothetical protein
MARNMLIAPGSQATTSTGLNYLLGEDNDTTRVPYKDGFSVQPFVSASKSNQGFEDGTNVDLQDLTYGGNVMYDKGPFSVGIEHLKGKDKYDFKYKDDTIVKDTSDRENTNLLFAIDIANTIKGKARLNKKGGQFEISMPFAEGGRIGYKEAGPVILPKPKPKPNADPLVELQRIYDLYQESMPGVSQETQKYLQQDFIQKLNDAGISQEQFMTNRMQNNFANGGRTGFKGGGSDASTTSFSQSYDRQHGTNTASRANRSVDRQQAAGQRDADRTNDRMANTDLGREQALNNYVAVNYPNQINRGGIFNSIKNNRFINNPFTRGALRVGAYTYNPALMGTDLRSIMQAKDIYNRATNFTKEDMTLGIVSEQQQKEIDKQAKTANLMNDTGKLTDIEKNTIFESVKPFDDKGSSGIFGIGATEPSPMTQSEFDTYIQEKGYAEGGPARQNFKMGKRAFLQWMFGTGAGIAGIKTGLLGLGKKTVAKSVIAPAAQAANEAGIPPYFFKLVNKIKSLGDDATPKYANQPRETVTRYKDYELTEHLDTGQTTVRRFKQSEADYYDEPLMEEVYMSHRPGEMAEGAGGKFIKTADEYVEDTSFLRTGGGNKGEVMDTVDGIPDDLLEELGETIVKKADGGRIGYKLGKKVIQEGIPGLIKKVNKLFGKEVVTTADKLPIPKKTLDRDMFKAANKRLNKKRQLTDEEIQDYEMELGDSETWMSEGTVGEAENALKNYKAYQDDMYQQYKMGKLDPVAGDKSPARKRFLEQKLADMEASGDKRLMTRDEIEELSTFDLGTQMDQMKEVEINKIKTLPKIDDKLLKNYIKEIKAGVDDVMRDTSPAGLEKSIEIDNLMLKYPGMDKNLADQIASSSPTMKADMIAMVEQTFKMDEMGMSGDDIIQTFKNTPRTKQATGGLASMLGE